MLCKMLIYLSTIYSCLYLTIYGCRIYIYIYIYIYILKLQVQDLFLFNWSKSFISSILYPNIVWTHSRPFIHLIKMDYVTKTLVPVTTLYRDITFVISSRIIWHDIKELFKLVRFEEIVFNYKYAILFLFLNWYTKIEKYKKIFYD